MALTIGGPSSSALAASFARRWSSLIARMTADGVQAFPDLASTDDVPTITAGTTATVSGTIIGTHTGQVTEVGTRGSWNAAAGRLTVQGYGSIPGLDFYLAGTTVEIRGFPSSTNASTPLWVWVNGRPVTATPGMVSMTGGSDFYIKLVFPTSKRRRVEVFSTNNVNAWREVRVDNTTLVAPAPRRPAVAFIGDSFFDSSDAANTLQSAPFIMSRMLGVECLNYSYGGTGYVAAGAFQTFGSTTRQTLLSASSPELIVVSGSVNDGSSVATAAASTYAAWRSILPNAGVIAFGPQPSNAADTIGSGRASRNQEVKAAALAAPNVLAFHDMIGTADALPAAWSSATTYNEGDRVTYQGSVWEWRNNGVSSSNQTPLTSHRWRLVTWAYTGTGQVGTTTSNGTRDVYLHSDGVHPTVAGSEALAIRQAQAIRETLRGLAA